MIWEIDKEEDQFSIVIQLKPDHRILSDDKKTPRKAAVVQNYIFVRIYKIINIVERLTV